MPASWKFNGLSNKTQSSIADASTLPVKIQMAIQISFKLKKKKLPTVKINDSSGINSMVKSLNLKEQFNYSYTIVYTLFKSEIVLLLNYFLPVIKKQMFI